MRYTYVYILILFDIFLRFYIRLSPFLCLYRLYASLIISMRFSPCDLLKYVFTKQQINKDWVDGELRWCSDAMTAPGGKAPRATSVLPSLTYFTSLRQTHCIRARIREMT